MSGSFVIKSIPFVKMHTLGNDFVILDRLDSSFYLDSFFVKTIAHRKFGIGFDQLLVLEAPITPDHDFSFQVFNANGHSANQCLNGARALFSYIFSESLTFKSKVKIQISDQSIEGEQVSSTVVKTRLCNPASSFTVEPIVIDEMPDKAFHKVYCGNQHIIAWDISGKHKNSVLLSLKNQEYTFDDYNISFARLENKKVILETMERGAGKTLSCGSASLSTYVSYCNLHDSSENLKIETSAGFVTAGKNDDSFFLTGPTQRVFAGEFGVRYRSPDKRKYAAD